MSTFVVITVAADAPAPSGDGASAGTVMTEIVSAVGLALEELLISVAYTLDITLIVNIAPGFGTFIIICL